MVHKFLYGLKQDPRQWNHKLTEDICDIWIKQSQFDYSLFTQKVNTKIVVILIYVDDLVITKSCI